MTISIAIKATPNEIKKAWCVYTIHDAMTAKIKYAGYGMLRDIFKMRIDAALDEPVILRVNDLYNSKIGARCGYIAYINAHGVPEGGLIMRKARNAAIECIETGETWNSAKACVKSCNISQSALSNHLNGHPSYKSVKNLTYRRVAH